MDKVNVALLDPSNFTVPYDCELIRGLEAAGVNPVLYGRAPRTGEKAGTSISHFDQRFHSIAERIRRGPAGGIYRPVKLIEHWWNLRAMASHLVNEHDLVHFQWIIAPLAELGAIRRIRRNRPVVCTIHDTKAFHGSPSSRLQLFRWNALIHEFDHLIVHTDFSKREVLRWGIPESKISVVPHGLLPLADTGPEPGPMKIDGGKRRFLLFGHLKPYKGIDTLLEAIVLLSPETRARIEVVIAGKPSVSADELTASFSQAGLDGTVRIVPRFLTEAELSSFIEQAHVLLFPYHRIDASGALLAALGKRRALIVSGLPAFEEALSGDGTALVVEPGNPESLAQAMTRIVESDDLLKALAEGAGQAARRLPSWEEIGGLTRDVYVAILERTCERRQLA